ncbi:prolyl-tRNA synthetase associated domain-containing protein [Sporomusa sp. KB1]|jgi:Ala-tRNA(Pro) deacylase|uniref:prolyl-tRNA synthetase associated domain-containing protein n=1 Tax=Sporomusa sp. KB1 TaxID=943346 RepID=UPI00119FD18D|nr:prolyl-tRNA synthetase associated domain-containing protein [Sporomusa sp. KB1]TWH47246.1 Ala-tRNA(Pro) deacylase [Sporomusa sp. KB1]
MEQDEKVFQVLNELNISYQLYQHPPVYTVEEWNQYIGGEDGVMCKSLFLRNQKGNRHFLVVADHSTAVNLKVLAELLAEKQLSFASEKRLEQYLGLSRGAVSPFGLLNDDNKEVTVVLDASIKRYSSMKLHPNINTETVTISYSDLGKFIQWRGNKLLDINLQPTHA